MRPDLRKIWVVASTEFGSLVRSKSFLITLLMLPFIYGLAFGLQYLVTRRVDTRPRSFAVVDRTGTLYPAIEQAARAYNKQAVGPDGHAVHPQLDPSLAGAGATDDALALELSDRIRRGELDAYVVIPVAALQPSAPDAPSPTMVEYHSDNPNEAIIPNWLNTAVNAEIRAQRFRGAGMDAAVVERLSQPVALDHLGLVEHDPNAPPGSTVIRPAQRVDRILTIAVPVVLLLIVFMVIVAATPQLVNSVIEEKMSKISEVLLGSVTPFELMMGKLLANTGIGAVLAALYVGGGYSVAAYYGYAGVISAGLMVAMAVFLVLAILLYGSLFMAVGAVCNDLKDAQSMMMPVMILMMLPTFVLSAILINPSSSLSVGLSLLPTASPYLMLMRMAMRPSPPAWQVGLSIAGTTLTALFCVWAAAKIFRTELLMQGKAPTYRELARWLMAK
jgi:ABC-2 type transport system permease protein